MSTDKKKSTVTVVEEKPVKDEEKKICGIVRPIAEIDGLPSSHWDEVANIIEEAIVEAGFKANLVSNSEDIGVIQKRIVQNLYANPIVVCDVSAKNPNVMFELGLRLAFDKPTIIVKDDKTNYSFDTSPIEHLEYPRDLRFSKIREFKSKLTSKILNTYRKSTEDEDFSTFLRHFGTFKVAKIETEEVTKEDLIMDEVKSLRNLITRMNSRVIGNNISTQLKNEQRNITLCFKGEPYNFIEGIEEKILFMEGIVSIQTEPLDEHHYHIVLEVDNKIPFGVVMRKVKDRFSGVAEWIR